MIYEVALNDNGKWARSMPIKQENLFDWLWEAGETNQAYMSVYCYDDAAMEYMFEHKAAEWSLLRRHIEWVPFDIDRGDNSDEKTLELARGLIIKLEEHMVTDENYKIYFSGSGYHVMVHQDVFNFNQRFQQLLNAKAASEIDFPYFVKESLRTISDLHDFMDMSIYHRTAVIRCPFSLNKKTGLYKTPLTRSELFNMSVQEIHDIARTRRDDFEFLDEYYGEGQLEHCCIKKLPEVKTFLAVREPNRKHACIYRMLNEGPVTGTRNNRVLVLASHLANMGIPSEYAKKLLLSWNGNSLNETILLEKVEYAYNNGYSYGCNSPFKKQLCSTRCIDYAKKPHSDTPRTMEQIIASAKEFSVRDLMRSGINLSHLFGMKSNFNDDYVVINKDLVALLGLTKAGKSTLMKHIILGMSLSDMNVIHPEYRRKTLYFTLEEASEMWVFTACKLLENITKDEMMNRQKEVISKWEHAIAHVVPIDTAVSYDALEELIVSHQAEQVVIDTIDQFTDNPNNEHLGIKTAMLRFQKICHEHNVIIYVVSQVKRSHAMDNIVTLFSGKGSGSIENQSRKVIGLSNTDIDHVKEITFLANSSGSFGDSVRVQQYNTQRMKII